MRAQLISAKKAQVILPFNGHCSRLCWPHNGGLITECSNNTNLEASLRVVIFDLLKAHSTRPFVAQFNAELLLALETPSRSPQRSSPVPHFSILHSLRYTSSCSKPLASVVAASVAGIYEQLADASPEGRRQVSRVRRRRRLQRTHCQFLLVFSFFFSLFILVVSFLRFSGREPQFVVASDSWKKP